MEPIDVELNTRITGLTEERIEALTSGLDEFAATMTYSMDTGRLFIKASVADMRAFSEMDLALVGMLEPLAPHLHYAYRVTRQGILY